MLRLAILICVCLHVTCSYAYHTSEAGNDEMESNYITNSKSQQVGSTPQGSGNINRKKRWFNRKVLVARLEAKLTQLNKQYEEALSELQELEQRHKNETLKLKEVMEELKAENSYLQNRYGDLALRFNQSVEGHEIETSKLKDEIANLSAENSIMAEHNKVLITELDDRDEDHANETSKLKTEISNLREQMERLRQNGTNSDVFFEMEIAINGESLKVFGTEKNMTSLPDGAFIIEDYDTPLQQEVSKHEDNMTSPSHEAFIIEDMETPLQQ